LLLSIIGDSADTGTEWTNRIMEWGGECSIITDKRSSTTADM